MGVQSVSVIVPAHSLERWNYLREAVASIQKQTVKVLETVIAIDHNPELAIQAKREFSHAIVVSNSGCCGASSNRNEGVAASSGDLLAFLDDDAVANPDWLEVLLKPLTDPSVVGVGGRLEPLWETSRPRWFPAEFDWVVGCSYRGMPQRTSSVRNVWGNNMAMRREVFDAVGGFRDGFGKVGNYSHPEDTDLCLRAAAHNGGGIWLYEPKAVVGHQIPETRTAISYFCRRCYLEGRGKADLAALNGATESTSLERWYVRRVLPSGFIRGFREMGGGDASGLARSCAIAAGMSLTTIGFIARRVAMVKE